MMAVNPARLSAIHTNEFRQLMGDHILERGDQTRLEHGLRKAAPEQIAGDTLLMFCQATRNTGSGERCGDVQVNACINSLLLRNGGGTLGVLHKNHCANRGHSSCTYTVESS